MRVGADFATAGALQLKVRAQARRIEELEGGGAYAAEVARRKTLQREYESRTRKLKREVAELGRLNAKMSRGWWETCEMVRVTVNYNFANFTNPTHHFHQRSFANSTNEYRR